MPFLGPWCLEEPLPLLYTVMQIQCHRSPVRKFLSSVTCGPPAAFPPQSAASLWVFLRLRPCSAPRCQSSPSLKTALVSLLQQANQPSLYSFGGGIKHSACFGELENSWLVPEDVKGYLNLQISPNNCCAP